MTVETASSAKALESVQVMPNVRIVRVSKSDIEEGLAAREEWRESQKDEQDPNQLPWDGRRGTGHSA